MSAQRKITECWECSRKRERCKPAAVTESGETVWICPECWRELDYEKYVTGVKES